MSPLGELGPVHSALRGGIGCSPCRTGRPSACSFSRPPRPTRTSGNSNTVGPCLDRPRPTAASPSSRQALGRADRGARLRLLSRPVPVPGPRGGRPGPAPPSRNCGPAPSRATALPGPGAPGPRRSLGSSLALSGCEVCKPGGQVSLSGWGFARGRRFWDPGRCEQGGAGRRDLRAGGTPRGSGGALGGTNRRHPRV